MFDIIITIHEECSLPVLFPLLLYRYGGWAMERPEEASTNETAVQVWFNNKGYHSLPSFYNGYSNALLRAKVDPAKNPAEYGKCLKLENFGH